MNRKLVKKNLMDLLKLMKDESETLHFREEEFGFMVEFNKDIVNQMLNLCENSFPNETGGILIGKYSIDNSSALIKKITPAPKDSEHKRFSFVRGVAGLESILNKEWKKGRYYLGEWHYHPSASSYPSQKDKNQMLKISQDIDIKCPEPILIIIGGNKENWTINVSMYIKK